MNVKRSVKSAAVKGAASPLGLAPFVAGGLLWPLKIDFDAASLSRRMKGAPAPVVVSVDFDVTEPSRYEANREGTSRLLELAARHSVPITWAICGKAAEDDMKSYQAIVSSQKGHEIGVHTYSHMDATSSTGEAFREDILRCMRALGLDSPKSFVFPWNREAHFEVLEDLGFRAYRGKARALGLPIPRNSLWNVRPVYYVDQKSMGAEALINSYADLCARHGAVFHLWTHPWALVGGGKTDEMMQTLDAVFGHIGAQRRAGVLHPMTMGDLVSIRTNSESPLTGSQSPLSAAPKG